MGRTQSQRPRTPYKTKAMKVSNEEKKAVECGYSLFSADAIEAPLELLHIWHYNPDEDGQVLKAANTDRKEEMFVLCAAIPSQPNIAHSPHPAH